MEALDETIAGLGAGHPLLAATLVALALGLRHASDPDHVVAVGSLVAGEGPAAGRPLAARLGLAWGAGHALTLALAGAPVILAADVLGRARSLFEPAIGLVIVALGVRLLVRRAPRRGAARRTERAAFAVGLLHGLGGSAGVGLLLLAGIADTRVALVALVVFAAGTAVSMAACSAAIGTLFTLSPRIAASAALTPAFGVGAIAFGLFYVVSGVGGG